MKLTENGGQREESGSRDFIVDPPSWTLFLVLFGSMSFGEESREPFGFYLELFTHFLGFYFSRVAANQ